MTANTPFEEVRIDDLHRMMPTNRRTLLEVGARRGIVTERVHRLFERVTALDLETPEIRLTNVECVRGDASDLRFADRAFDVVLCSEVLEHIPPDRLSKACRELARVARHEVLVGVPFNQDLRLFQTTCRACGHVNPPWGHVNSFTEKRLYALFGNLEVKVVHKVYRPEAPRRYNEKSNFLSSYLLSAGGNPWGSYDQEEPCVRCGEKLVAPTQRTFAARSVAKLGHLLLDAQNRFLRPQPTWMHVLFSAR